MAYQMGDVVTFNKRSGEVSGIVTRVNSKSIIVASEFDVWCGPRFDRVTKKSIKTLDSDTKFAKQFRKLMDKNMQLPVEKYGSKKIAEGVWAKEGVM
jgi:hypothetical protein